jgi:hypothetical protein
MLCKAEFQKAGRSCGRGSIGRDKHAEWQVGLAARHVLRQPKSYPTACPHATWQHAMLVRPLRTRDSSMMDSDVWKSELSVFVSPKNVNMNICIHIHF